MSNATALQAKELTQAILTAQKFAGDSGKNIINRVLVNRVLVNKDVVVATDGYRLVKINLNAPVEREKFLVGPIKAPRKNVTVQMTENAIVYSDGTGYPFLDASEYPNYAAVIPELDRCLKVQFDVDTLGGIANMLSNETELRFDFADNSMTLTASSNVAALKNNCKLKTTFDVNYGYSNSVGFLLNTTYLKEALATIKHSNVDIYFAENGAHLKPIAFEAGNILHLIMPLDRI